MTDNKPKYQVVIDWINEEIASGRMRIGDRLMPEEKLSKKFGLCRQTIRRATSQLVEEKVLTRLQGSGTYVGQILPHTPKKKHMNVAVVSTYSVSYTHLDVYKRQGEGNVAFTVGDWEAKYLNSTFMERFQIKLLVYRGHPLSQRKSVTIQDLKGEPLYIESSEFHVQRLIVDRCRAAGFEPNIVFETSGFSPVSYTHLRKNKEGRKETKNRTFVQKGE